MVNPKGFRHSGLLNTSTEADIQRCSCMKHLHSEVGTAVHNGKRVYFVCACCLADNTQRMRMHGEYAMPDKETLCIHGRTQPGLAWPDYCAEKAREVNLIIHFIQEKPSKTALICERCVDCGPMTCGTKRNMYGSIPLPMAQKKKGERIYYIYKY